jgi:hypothetical protein
MSATWEGGGHYDLQAWTDMLWLRSAVAQSREFNNAARTRLEAVKDETVLALSDADKTLQAPLTSDRIRRRDPRVTPFPKIAQPSLSKPDNRLSGRPQPPNGVRWPYGMLLRNTRSCVVQASASLIRPRSIDAPFPGQQIERASAASEGHPRTTT